jgi:hypothetical protein
MQHSAYDSGQLPQTQYSLLPQTLFTKASQNPLQHGSTKALRMAPTNSGQTGRPQILVKLAPANRFLSMAPRNHRQTGSLQSSSYWLLPHRLQTGAHNPLSDWLNKVFRDWPLQTLVKLAPPNHVHTNSPKPSSNSLAVNPIETGSTQSLFTLVPRKPHDCN